MLRKLFNRLVLALLPFTLIACATLAPKPSAKVVYAETVKACIGALNTFSLLHKEGKLSPGQVQTINTATAILSPIIKGPIPSNPTQDIAILNKALAQFALIRQHPGA